MVERLLFRKAGAGAGEKNTRSLKKTDQLRNTACRALQGSGFGQIWYILIHQFKILDFFTTVNDNNFHTWLY